MPTVVDNQPLPVRFRMVDRNTTLGGAYFNPLLQVLELRLSKLEQLSTTWQGVTDEVVRYGLRRLDEVIRPLLEQARADLEALAVSLGETQADFEQQAAGSLADLQSQAGASLAALEADSTAAVAALQQQVDAAEAEIADLVAQVQAQLAGIGYLGWIAPASGATSYTYDGAGRLETGTETLPGGNRVTSYTYDGSGRLATAATAYLGVTRTVTYSYDGSGRVNGESVVEA